jgi:hypothetical protein
MPNEPRAARVQAPHGAPERVGRELVDAIVEDWLVEDRWWTEKVIRRRYWEVLTVSGRRVVVFHDLQGGGWYTQAG